MKLPLDSGHFKEAVLSALDPGKQGLKHIVFTDKYASNLLSALDPGKQGLKLHHPILKACCRFLSALDPGKQGLKLQFDLKGMSVGPLFQRLIQENKD